ncbi:MAG: murein biosynthesis integral membrane protein MurJ [Desulfovibrionaceae bacterium]
METRRDPPPSLAGSTLLVSGTSLASRVLGFVRDMLMAWLLGGGPAADALVVALRLPHVLRRLLGEGSLSMTLTAHLVHSRQGSPSPAASFALAWAVGLRITLGLVVIICMAEVAARPLIDGLAPGLAAHPTTAPTAAQASVLFRICLPYALAAGMAALGMAFLHSMGHFLVPALSPLCFNTVIIVFALLAACHVGSPAPMLAYGFLAGGLVQGLLPCFALWRMGLWPYRKPAPPRDKIHACLRALPAGLLGAAAPQIAMLCAMAVASFLPSGAISALYYAERLLELPMSVTGTALGMVSLPALAALGAQHQHEAFNAHCAKAMRLSLLLALPATAGLLAVNQALIAVLLGHGAFDSHAVHNTALALSGYAYSLPLYALSRPLLAACNARKLTRLSACSGAAAVLCTLASAVILLYWLPPSHAILGPPLALGCGLGLQTTLLWRAVNLPARTLAGPAVYTMLLASLLTFGAARLMVQLISSPPVALAAGVMAGAGVYALSLLLLRHEDTQNGIRWYKKRLATRQHKGNKP